MTERKSGERAEICAMRQCLLVYVGDCDSVHGEYHPRATLARRSSQPAAGHVCLRGGSRERRSTDCDGAARGIYSLRPAQRWAAQRGAGTPTLGLTITLDWKGYGYEALNVLAARSHARLVLHTGIGERPGGCTRFTRSQKRRPDLEPGGCSGTQTRRRGTMTGENRPGDVATSGSVRIRQPAPRVAPRRRLRG